MTAFSKYLPRLRRPIVINQFFTFQHSFSKIINFLGLFGDQFLKKISGESWEIIVDQVESLCGSFIFCLQYKFCPIVLLIYILEIEWDVTVVSLLVLGL